MTELMDKAVADYGVTKFFALFSGGHDSLCATHLAMQHPLCKDVVHINTGIGIQKTNDYVKAVCKAQGWSLIEIRAKEDCGQDYEEVVLKHGFPGAHGHRYMYIKLKERALGHLMRHYTEKKTRIGFITGVRSDESVRRMRHVEKLQREGRKVWVAVCHDWKKHDQFEYMAKHNLPKNPVKEIMCMSGECLCGAFAQKGELAEWVSWFKDDPGVQKLLAIRDKVIAKFPWDWDDPGPPKWWQEKNKGQTFMFSVKDMTKQFLCVNCNRRNEAYDDAVKEFEIK